MLVHSLLLRTDGLLRLLDLRLLRLHLLLLMLHLLALLGPLPASVKARK